MDDARSAHDQQSYQYKTLSPGLDACIPRTIYDNHSPATDTSPTGAEVSRAAHAPVAQASQTWTSFPSAAEPGPNPDVDGFRVPSYELLVECATPSVQRAASLSESGSAGVGSRAHFVSSLSQSQLASHANRILRSETARAVAQRRKRRLTDSIPSGREGLSRVEARSPDRLDMASSSLMDRTPPSVPGRLQTWNGEDRPHERRQSNLHPRADDNMRIESSLLSDRHQAEGYGPTNSNMRLSGNFVLPRWQPDSAVSSCPICKTTFTFFYRKHHCRKCGRVVCAACSPHRVMIPFQFIVQPPPVIDLTDLEPELSQHQANARNSFPANGGTQVRVCNPCLPDPNLSPPFHSGTTCGQASWGAVDWSDGDASHSGQPESVMFPPAHGLPNWFGGDMHSPQPFAGYLSNTDRFADGRVSFTNPSSVSDLFPPPAQLQHSTSTGSVVGFPPGPSPRQARGLGMPPSGQLTAPRTSSRPHQSRHSFAGPVPGSPSASAPYPVGPRYRSLLGPLPPNPPQASPLHRSAHGNTQHPPRRQVAEEDECPVCGTELPPKDADGSEAARERHVEDCIASHFAPSSSSRPTSVAVPIPAQDTFNVPGPALVAVSSSAPPGDGISANGQAGTDTTAAHGSANSTNAAPRRRRATGNRMLVCTATEKDCVGEDGGAAECIICFEEFEPGVELGRLECLCKFHRTCIRQWWHTKGVGSCPTHQLHD